MAAGGATPVTGLGTGGFTILLDGTTFQTSNYVYGLVGATGAFDVHFEVTGDGGATWIPVKKISSAAGPDATYTQVAEISQYLWSFARIRLKNTTGGNINVLPDVRTFAAGWR